MNHYTKLQMTADKNEGSFVRNLQGQTGTGFHKGTHVHKDWWATTISYDDAMENLQRSAQDREDLMAPVKSIEATVNDDGNFVFNVDDREFEPTDWALQQFSIRAAVPSSTVISKLREQDDYDSADAEVMAMLANNALRRLDPEKKYRLRTYTDGTCRAFVTDRYAPIDNRWYLEQLKQNLPEGRLSHWRGDEDTIYGNILLPDTIIDYGQSDDSDYGGMMSIGNCEIGKRRISQMPSLFRSICMNGCIWGQVSGKKISRVHRGKIDLGELRVQIQDNIEAQLNLIPAGMERFMASRDLEITGSLKNVIATVCKESKLSKKESSEVLGQYLKHESDHRNLFGVVNAVTRAGQVLDNESWVKFDNLGGKLLDTTPAKWENVLKRASSWEDKDVNAVFTGKVAV